MNLRAGMIGLASVVLGFFLMFPLGKLFDTMNWPIFHSWGLVHGSFLLAWPGLTILSFKVLRGAVVRREQEKSDSN